MVGLRGIKGGVVGKLGISFPNLNVRSEQQRSLLQLVFRSNGGRKAPGADSGELAEGSERNRVHADSLAERFAAGRLFDGLATAGCPEIARANHVDAIRRRSGGSTPAVLGRKSHMVTSDKSGRITLPEHMATAVGLEKKAVLVGMFDRFQLWNPEKFEAITEGDDALAQEAFKLI